MSPYARGRTIPLVEEISYPLQGSAIVNWDFDVPLPPSGNQPPSEDHPDPHEVPRRDPQHNQQMIHFWNTGEIIDTCEGRVCGAMYTSD